MLLSRVEVSMSRVEQLQRALQQHAKVATQLDEQLDRSRTPKLRMAAADKAPKTVESFDSPDSSTIEGASFNHLTGTMTVRFKRSGNKPSARYSYKEVPPSVWAKFLAAESKGQFFAVNIRPHFKGEPLAA